MTDESPVIDLPNLSDDLIDEDIPHKDIPLDDLGMVETFLKSRWNSDDIAENTYEGYEAGLYRYFNWLQETGMLANPFEVRSSDIVTFGEQMRVQYADSTVKTILAQVSGLYNYFERQSDDALISNPVPGALEDLGLSYDGKDWPRVSREEMAHFIKRIENPRDRAEALVLVKHGIRLGELYNLDLHDIQIDYAPLRQNEYYSSIDTRPELQGRKDVIYVDPEVEKGKPFRGEERNHSNKRSVGTYLPVDGELKHALVRWLAARPSTYNHPAEPLFVGEMSIKENRYHRQSATNIRNRIRQYADELGWNDRADADVTPHFFRHFFTTHHRLPMDDLLVDYIRGDTLGTRRRNSPGKGESGKAKNDYTHEEWMRGLKQPYLDDIYEFGLPRLRVATER